MVILNALGCVRLVLRIIDNIGKLQHRLPQEERALAPATQQDHASVPISPAPWRRSIFWESAIWLALGSGWIWVLSLGNENGFGYFQQPEQSLTAPLIIGGTINAALFVMNAFYAIPRFLEKRRWRRYALVALALLAANILLQTTAQKLIILFSEPALATLSWTALLIENTYLAPFVLILSTLYKFSRDWAIHVRERHALHEETNSLKQTLQDTRKEMHILSSAGNPESFLQVSAGNERLQIPISAIQYMRSAGNYADIVTPNRTHLAYGALKDLIKKLPHKRFVRIHRSYIVGMEHIVMIKGNAVHLGSTKLPIGAAYKKAFLQQWAERAQSE